MLHFYDEKIKRKGERKKNNESGDAFFFFVNIGEFVFNIQNNRPNLLRVLTFFALLLGLEDTDDLGYVMGQLVCLYSWRSFPGSRMASYFYGRFVVYGDLLFGGLVFTAATAVYYTTMTTIYNKDYSPLLRARPFAFDFLDAVTC